MIVEIRCTNCNKLLATVKDLRDGEVKIKCKCGTVNSVAARTNIQPEGQRKETGIIKSNSSRVVVRE